MEMMKMTMAPKQVLADTSPFFSLHQTRHWTTFLDRLGTSLFLLLFFVWVQLVALAETLFELGSQLVNWHRELITSSWRPAFQLIQDFLINWTISLILGVCKDHLGFKLTATSNNVNKIIQNFCSPLRFPDSSFAALPLSFLYKMC